MSCSDAPLEGNGDYLTHFCFEVRQQVLGVRGKEGEGLEEEDGLWGEGGKSGSKISSSLSL